MHLIIYPITSVAVVTTFERACIGSATDAQSGGQCQLESPSLKHR